MKKEELIEKTVEKLKMTDIYNDVNMKFIEDVFNDSHYDMLPNIKIKRFSKKARLSTYERGECICEYFTCKQEEVIYSLLEYSIGITVEKVQDRKYIDENGCLDMTDEIRKEYADMMENAFVKIGEPYYTWYKQGKNYLKMQ